MFKCELKKLDPIDGTFYRYSMDDNKVWFTQSQKGNIYTVHVSPDKKLKGIDIYVHIRESEEYNYYPDYSYIYTSSERLYDNIDEYIEKLEYAKLVQEEVMKIFELPEHKSEVADNE
jgi:protein associated with RNAse G/E